MKKVNQNWMKLRDFCRKYNFITSCGASQGFHNHDKPYFSSMKKVKNEWYIDVNRYIKEMYKKYPEIDGVSKRKIGKYSATATKLYRYLNKKSFNGRKNPTTPIFIAFALCEKKIRRRFEIKSVTPIKKIQKVAVKSFEDFSAKRKELLWQLDSTFCYLMDAYWEESFENFAKIFYSTTEEFFKYVLKEMDKKSA